MENINWGMIGCGDVTEVKSGPAFNKVPNSKLVAVMRRDAAKAKDYAERHGVPKWYSDASALINDPEINAIYIATPPSSHLEYAIAALKAGKFVYVEKPMTTDLSSAIELNEFVIKSNGKLAIAHYRRQQPQFKKIKELIDEKVIGEIKLIDLKFYRKSIKAAQLDISKYAWRVDPSISGGGLFHDIAPHQLDLMYHYFGEIENAHGFSINTNELYSADDVVSGQILFKNKIVFNGTWCFNIGENAPEDFCEIIGKKGRIQFSFFDKQEIKIISDNEEQIIPFEKLIHAQQPMIENVVNYFLNKGANPCPVEEGVKVLEIMEKFTAKN